MTNAVTRSTRSGLAAALSLFTLGLCGAACAAPSAFINVIVGNNTVSLPLVSVASGDANILQWKTVVDPAAKPVQPLSITNSIKGLENIAWSTTCDQGIRLTLNTLGNRDILTMLGG